MSRVPRTRPGAIAKLLVCAAVTCLLTAIATPECSAQPLTADRNQPASEILALESAVTWALQNNPELAALRKQYGVAAAGVVIARTYPYNPTLDSRVQGVSGPQDSGITSSVATQFTLGMVTEIRGQGRYRREGAQAALSRTEWEIAYQETLLAVRTVRAFQAVLYREDKARVFEETLKLNEQVAEQASSLLKQGKLTAADLIVARTEVDDTQAQAKVARSLLTAARYDLRRALGITQELGSLHGKLTTASIGVDEAQLTQMAFERRADLQARRAALAEADARLRLTVADRIGSPNLNVVFSTDQSRIYYVGPQVGVPLPLFNRKQGEIMQNEAIRARTVQELRQIEVTVVQDVQAALSRFHQAHDLVATYQSRILPNLVKGQEDLDRLFLQGNPGADILRVVDMRRKLLRAREGYLDASWELNQARADLAAATGDIAVVLPSATVPTAPVATLLAPH